MAPLNYINYLNVAASCIIALYTIDLDLGPEYDFFNKFNMREYPRRYEEGSMTPAEPFFFIFNIVAFFLMIFAVVQLLPAYRSSPMVQEGVEYWYFGGAIAHLFAYNLADEANESFTKRFFSTFFFGVVAGCVWKILDNQARATRVSDNSTEEFWLLRFPFSLQAAWIISTIIMSANVLFKNEDGGNDDDAGFNYSSFMYVLVVLISLVVYAGLSVKLLLFNGDSPNYVIPAVISLVTYGIAMNNREDQEGTWASITMSALVYLISIGSGLGTAYLFYTKEYKSASSSDAVEPLSKNSYQGEEMASTKSSNSDEKYVMVA